LFYFKAFGQLRSERVKVVDVYIEYFAGRGVERVMMVVNIGVESHRPPSQCMSWISPMSESSSSV